MNISAFSENDTFALTMFLALAFHSVLIFGVTFDFEEVITSPAQRTLEIMVVRHPNKANKPDKADFLAQTSQEGGGNLEKRAKPKTRITPTTTRPTPQPSRESAGKGKPKPQAARKKTISAKQAKKRRPKKRSKRPSPTKRMTADDLLAQSNQEIQRLSAELDIKMEAYAKRPRRKFISAATQEYKYAAYLSAWKRKVERIGTLNFPDEAKRKKMYGNLVLHVSILRDGTIEKILLKRSSGHKVLDDAAIRIVRLAAPYAPFPKDIAAEVDVLDITRTWQFLTGNRLFTGK